MEIVRQILDKKQDYLTLLLEADPDASMIARYLERGRLYVLEEDRVVIAVAVTVDLDAQRCELKNIAVAPACQRRGIGARLLRCVLATEGGRFSQMLVGTTAPQVPFYESIGFVYSHRVENFFLDNYKEPIFEGDTQCVDMIYLKRAIFV